jgi:Flp pilus assembly pilin Flp
MRFNYQREANMRELLVGMVRGEEGQDLVEYSLLISFICFITIGVISIGGTSIKGIVNVTNSNLATGNQIAQS